MGENVDSGRGGSISIAVSSNLEADGVISAMAMVELFNGSSSWLD